MFGWNRWFMLTRETKALIRNIANVNMTIVKQNRILTLKRTWKDPVIKLEASHVVDRVKNTMSARIGICLARFLLDANSCSSWYRSYIAIGISRLALRYCAIKIQSCIRKK